MGVFNQKPTLKLVDDIKSRIRTVKNETKTYLESKTILKGQPIGLLLSITYPEESTFIITRE